MTTPSNSEPPTLRFAFPFRDAKGKEIVDEHVLHAWLANEKGGHFAVSGGGMWHGGIHISAAGAGQQLDLEHGVRCIATGEVIAYRMNRVPLTSQIPAGNGEPAHSPKYSSAFTLVRHTLEYPLGNQLTFFSLYMHLQSVAEYEQKSIATPAYWARVYEVTQHAVDKPQAGPYQRAAKPDQQGLNIRAEPGGTPILGILPHGAKVRIGERSQNGHWGRIEVIESGVPIPPQVASYVHPGADKGWVYLDKERGQRLLEPAVSDAQCDRIITPPIPIAINTGDLIGHLGQYWFSNSKSRLRRPERTTTSGSRGWF